MKRVISKPIPRHHCRGPIEAEPEATKSASAWRIPRHHCRGPIEATHGLDVICLYGSDSTASLPWPH